MHRVRIFTQMVMKVHHLRIHFSDHVLQTAHPQRAEARLTQKKKLHLQFLQNQFFHTSIYVIQGKKFCSAIESATQIFF